MSGLTIWTVYENPTDYPGKFIARKWVGLLATEEVLIRDDLHSIQQELWKRGLIRLPRQEGDDPNIVETWL